VSPLNRFEDVAKAILSSVTNSAEKTAWDSAWTEEMSDACGGYYEVVDSFVG
jgi:hypothetical protein